MDVGGVKARGVAVLLEVESDTDEGWSRVADAMSLLKWHGRPRGIYGGVLLVRWAGRRVALVGKYSRFASLLTVDRSPRPLSIDSLTKALSGGHASECPPPEEGVGIEWLASQPGESCQEACGRHGEGLRCDTRALWGLNSCPALSKLLGCNVTQCTHVKEVQDAFGRRMEKGPEHHHPSRSSVNSSGLLAECTTQIPRYLDCEAWAAGAVRACACVV